MIQDWQQGVLIKTEQATYATRRFWIEIPAKPIFDFRPGQFVTLDLPISEQRNKRWRSYSIASAPDGTNIIELIIVNMEGGTGTQYIFNELKIGSEIQLRGPLGNFTLPHLLDKDLFLICTGTGIAPFRSMVHYVLSQQIPFKNIYLIFGTRKKEDLLYTQELRDLEKKMSGFKYIPTLSRENWEGETGYVHNIYETLCQNKQPATFMLCGWRPMVDEAKQRILEIGYEKKDIILEVYG